MNYPFHSQHKNCNTISQHDNAMHAKLDDSLFVHSGRLHISFWDEMTRPRRTEKLRSTELKPHQWPLSSSDGTEKTT